MNLQREHQHQHLTPTRRARPISAPRSDRNSHRWFSLEQCRYRLMLQPSRYSLAGRGEVSRRPAVESLATTFWKVRGDRRDLPRGFACQRPVSETSLGRTVGPPREGPHVFGESGVIDPVCGISGTRRRRNTYFTRRNAAPRLCVRRTSRRSRDCSQKPNAATIPQMTRGVTRAVWLHRRGIRNTAVTSRQIGMAGFRQTSSQNWRPRPLSDRLGDRRSGLRPALGVGRTTDTPDITTGLTVHEFTWGSSVVATSLWNS